MREESGWKSMNTVTCKYPLVAWMVVKHAQDVYSPKEGYAVRDECVNVRQFASLAETQILIEAWRLDNKQRRPHSSLGYLNPAQRQALQTVEEVVCSG
jgi:transposase InsO family protein